MNLSRIYPVFITAMLMMVVFLVLHGLLLPGFVLAGIVLGVAAHLYGAESPLPTFSKEEELAAWGVKWEWDNPTLVEAPASSSAKPRTNPRMQRGMP